MTRPNLKQWDLLKVEWIDSAGASDRWEFTEIVGTEPCRCQTVGWLIQQGEEVMVIAGHRTVNREQVNGHMVIPKVAVTKVTRLEKG